MRMLVQADDGDQVSITADEISVEQDRITLQIINERYGSDSQLEAVTLTLGNARELAKALFSVADAVEFVSRDADFVEWIARQQS